jgi:glycosyltransferase involved in cell wall biosynthesis
MERVFAELVRRVHARYELIVIASDLAPDLRPLVDWRRAPTLRRPAALRFLVFYAVGAVRLRRVRAGLVHTLGAIVPNKAEVVSVQFCHAAFREAAGGLAPPGAPPLRRLNTAAYRLLCMAAERWSYRARRAAVFSPVSDGVARELAHHYPEVPVAVARNGVDRRRFRPSSLARKEVRRSVGADEDELVALFVGGDWDRKGLAIAIEALAHARLSTDRPLTLWVVGDGDRARFDGLARASGVEDRVRFLGRRRDTERFYCAADVFVFPTFYEAFPLVALEAAASALPIVSPLVNGIEELVGQDEGGITVERTSEAFGAALARLAESPHLRRKLAASARTRSAAFTWERSAAAVEAVYAEILGTPGRPPANLAA